MNASYPKIRLATQADLPELIDMGKTLHEENGLLNVSIDRIIATAVKAVTQNGMIIGVIGEVGALEGMICLAVSNYWYTEDMHLEELFSFVRPEYRRSKNAKALVAFAKENAKKLKVPLLIGIISNTRTEAKVALYQRMLGKPAGAYFLWNGNTRLT